MNSVIGMRYPQPSFGFHKICDWQSNTKAFLLGEPTIDLDRTLFWKREICKSEVCVYVYEATKQNLGKLTCLVSRFTLLPAYQRFVKNHVTGENSLKVSEADRFLCTHGWLSPLQMFRRHVDLFCPIMKPTSIISLEVYRQRITFGEIKWF